MTNFLGYLFYLVMPPKSLKFISTITYPLFVNRFVKLLLFFETICQVIYNFKNKQTSNMIYLRFSIPFTDKIS